MSTRNDKCPHCGAMEVVFGTPLYTCGTTLGMRRVNRTMDCHATETKALLARIAALEKHVASMEEAGDRMFFSALDCRLIEGSKGWEKTKGDKPHA